MREENVFGILGVACAVVNPWLAGGFLMLSAWGRYDRYKIDKACNKTMRHLIRTNNPGLRSIVGNEEMERARALYKK